MNLKETITTRQSIRSFVDQKIERAEIKRILASAVCAPSSGNQQPWQFVVIDDPQLIEKACRTNLDAYWGVQAPAAILVCTNSERHKSKGFWVQGCAAVTQNILLLAHEAGLGATWTGVYPIEERMAGLKDLLNLPATVIPFALVIMGYPKRRSAKKGYSVEGKIQYNRFPPSTQYSYTKQSPSRPSKSSD
jgi:nitroreductase